VLAVLFLAAAGLRAAGRAAAGGTGGSEAATARAGDPAQGGAQDSGIEGHVEIRPVRSVERLGVPNAEPYQATVAVVDAQGNEVTRFTSDAQGNFRVALPPGRYVLRPESAGRYPRASTQSVVIAPHRFSQVDIVYDSGRR
jgi:carboxypeptidase family protein